MASKDSKVALLPIIGCAVAVVAALMLLLPVMVGTMKLTDTSMDATIFDNIEALLDGAEGTTLMTITTIAYYLMHLGAIVAAVLFGICIFVKNDGILKIAKIISLVVAGLGVIGLIFNFIALGDLTEDMKLIGIEYSVGIGAILATVFSVGLAACSYVIKK